MKSKGLSCALKMQMQYDDSCSLFLTCAIICEFSACSPGRSTSAAGTLWTFWTGSRLGLRINPKMSAHTRNRTLVTVNAVNQPTDWYKLNFFQIVLRIPWLWLNTYTEIERQCGHGRNSILHHTKRSLLQMGEKSEEEYVEWLNDLLKLRRQSTPITVHICRLCQFKVTANTFTSGISHEKQDDRLVEFRYAKKC
jgi:hypothetical protein